MNLLRILAFTSLLLALYTAKSQTCCNKKLQDGISAYNIGNYKTALSHFTGAKGCSDFSKCQSIDGWIARCKEKISPPPPPSVPANTNKSCFVKNIKLGQKAFDNDDFLLAIDAFQKAQDCAETEEEKLEVEKYISLSQKEYAKSQTRTGKIPALIDNYGDTFDYEGEIFSDLPNGEGVATYDNGSEYRGPFVNGARHGKGEMLLPDGSRFVGDFDDGVASGRGEYFWSDGSSYVGDIVKYKPEGQGTSRYNDSTIYIGQFHNCLKHGEGELYLHDRLIYEGTFVNGKAHGKGVRYWPDGSTYSGDFIDNNMTGQGLYKFYYGGRYEGTFLDNEITGLGKKIFPNGDEYFGWFLNETFHGEGEYSSKSDIANITGCKKYKGGWLYGQKSGHGVCYDESGNILFEGEFMNDSVVIENTPDITANTSSQTPVSDLAKLDWDGDSVPDRDDKCPYEKGLPIYNGCISPDRDNDGVPDNHDSCPDLVGQKNLGGCPFIDSDSDGLSDDEEVIHKTNPNKADTDGDGLTDFEEIKKKTNPLKKDSDSDGIYDGKDISPLKAGNNK